MKLKASLIVALLITSGCASFTVTQSDESPEARKITTKVTARAFFSSSQNITKLKALQTDKTQSFGSDIANQQGATNSVETLKALGQLLLLLK